MDSSRLFKVQTKYLLLLAGIVWAAAGINILIIGLREYGPYWSPINVALSVAVFAVFQVFIFGRLVKRHTARITSYTEKTKHFWAFFDLRSFLIMAGMIALGLWLRNSSWVPRVFIAVFYTGLGASLLLAGIQFACAYVRVLRHEEA